MKSLVFAAVAAAIVSTPLASFAQSNAPVTRAQVKAELVQLERNGYNPQASDAQYPGNAQTASLRAQPPVQTLTHADISGYGVEPVALTQTGHRAQIAPSAGEPVYFGR